MDKCSVTSVALIQDLKQDALKFLIYKKHQLSELMFWNA